MFKVIFRDFENKILNGITLHSQKAILIQSSLGIKRKVLVLIHERIHELNYYVFFKSLHSIRHLTVFDGTLEILDDMVFSFSHYWKIATEKRFSFAKTLRNIVFIRMNSYDYSRLKK